jgi:tight adherence protein B
MSPLLLQLAVPIGVAGSVTLLVLAIDQIKNQPKDRVESLRARRAAGQAARERKTLTDRFDEYLRASGLDTDQRSTALMTLAAAYLAVMLGLTIAGLHSVLSAVTAMPALTVSLFCGQRYLYVRRRRMFAFQLKQMFDLVRGQLEAGNGTARALNQVVGNLSDPLRSEFEVALSASQASGSIIQELTIVRDRYPSKAFDLFLTALRIDETNGGSLSDTLERASEMIQREFDLNQKASSELAQSKQTFWGVLGILSFITASSILGADDVARSAYLSLTGATVLLACAAWAGVGVFRANKIFRNAGGEL